MRSLVKSFTDNVSGTVSLKTALVFGAVAMAVSVLSAPVLNNVTETYAENRAFGIDRVMTGSIKKAETYIVRKSVLSENAERIDIQNGN